MLQSGQDLREKISMTIGALPKRGGLCVLALVAWVGQSALAASIPPFKPGDLLLMDSNASAGNGQLFKINRTTGAATPLGTGFGDEPWSLVLQDSGTLLVADASGEDIRRLDMSNGNWTPVSSGGLLRYPSGAMVSNGPNSVLVASGGNIVNVNTVTGAQTVFANYSQHGTDDAWGMTRAPDGSLLVTDLDVPGTIVRIEPNGVSSIFSSGGLLYSTTGIAVLPDGTVAVGNRADVAGRDSIVRIDPLTGAQSYLTPPGSFMYVTGLTLDTDGNLLVSDGGSATRGRVAKVRVSDGQITTFSNDSKLASPAGLIIVIPEPSAVALLFLPAWSAAFARRRRASNQRDGKQ
jgi:sugar lactone lactonase YvrE